MKREERKSGIEEKEKKEQKEINKERERIKLVRKQNVQ